MTLTKQQQAQITKYAPLIEWREQQPETQNAIKVLLINDRNITTTAAARRAAIIGGLTAAGTSKSVVPELLKPLLKAYRKLTKVERDNLVTRYVTSTSSKSDVAGPATATVLASDINPHNLTAEEYVRWKGSTIDDELARTGETLDQYRARVGEEWRAQGGDREEYLSKDQAEMLRRSEQIEEHRRDYRDQ